MTTYILYNPLAGSGECKKDAQALEVLYDNTKLIDVTQITNYPVFLDGLEVDDDIILCGGDGTLNRFANAIRDIPLKNNIYYYASGSGNDFVRDLGKEKGAQPTFRINKYLKNLPTVTVNGEERVFLNGVGYGIDGYCCEVGDQLRETSDKPVNYTSIAIKGLLFHYKPTNATVTVDGHTHTYEKVWIAPTMHGRYYGGGMIPTPGQQRLGKKNTLSLMIFHGSGKLRTLCIFPSIFKGEHIKHKNVVEIITGKDITVEYDRPAPLQIDGETILNVTKYHAVAYDGNKRKGG